MLRQLWVRLILILSFFIPFLLSFPVWFSERGFPVTPLFFDGLELNYFADIVLLICLVVSAIWFLFKGNGIGGLWFFLIYALLSVLDQTRIQPFFFEIAILIFFYYLFRNDFERFKIAFLLLMAGTYIWSGLHKINPVFFDFWLHGMDKRLPFIPLILKQLFTWIVPFLELSFGLALLFNKTRKIGIILLAIMHGMVLIAFTLNGVGFTVFPMNIINPLLLFMLCYRMNWTVFKLINDGVKLKIIAVYALVLPVLNLFGCYDHLLSFSYFSGGPDYCNIFFYKEEDVKKLPKELTKVVRLYEDQYYINVNEWSVKYVNVLCYPENRVYLYLQNYVEVYTDEKSTYLQYYKK